MTSIQPFIIWRQVGRRRAIRLNRWLVHFFERKLGPKSSATPQMDNILYDNIIYQHISLWWPFLLLVVRHSAGNDETIVVSNKSKSLQKLGSGTAKAAARITWVEFCLQRGRVYEAKMIMLLITVNTYNIEVFFERMSLFFCPYLEGNRHCFVHLYKQRLPISQCVDLLRSVLTMR